MIPPELWKPADGLLLEPNALRAATGTIGSLALTAGPGAGKTEMLAQRADFLLRTQTCRYPWRILAISFKVDASANLKERVRRRCGRDLSNRFDSFTFHAFAKRLIDRFRPALKGRSALDANYTIGQHRIHRTSITFAELIPLAIEILEHCEIARNALRQTYSDVFLDEFQDCTATQYELIKQAFLGTNIRIVAVGDTKQKIMGWAGALEGIFVDFASDFSARPLNLYRNFRSLPQLLRMQNEIVNALDPAAVMPDDLIEGIGGSVAVEHFEDSEAEASSVADQIGLWINEGGIPAREIAILVSKQPHLYTNLIMEKLQERGIPFRNEQALQDLASEAITKLVIDHLLVLFGEREPEAYQRLMYAVADTAADEEKHSTARTDWNRFLQEQREDAKGIDADIEAVWTLTTSFLQKVGSDHITSLSPDYESASRIDELVGSIKQHLSANLESEPDVCLALKMIQGSNAVRILTIHKSKGLEFDAVVILGVEGQTFWGNRSEQLCLFFVAVSRAKKHLVLTHADHRPAPASAPANWRERRTGHEEFLAYAEPFTD